MKEANKLIYEKGNNYRIHADNLRWTLLGGYVAILAALFTFNDAGNNSNLLEEPAIAFFLFIVSFCYLWIIAIQNWFYNLFARFVEECEYRLVNGEDLRTLQMFAKDVGPAITPFHPSFFLAELIVATAAFYFLVLVINNLYIPIISDYLSNLSVIISSILRIVVFGVYFGLLNHIFRKWEKIVYRKVIVKISNLYMPLEID